MVPTIKQRLVNSFIRKSDQECWPWIGPIKNKRLGYGYFFFGWNKDKKSAYRLQAHRAVFHLKYGPIPSGLFVCHKCDNPNCVNPNHLFLGTNKDNMRDMREKGRSTLGKPRPYNRGSGNGNCLFTEQQVECMRAMGRYGIRQQTIGQIFGAAQSTVGRYIRNETHKV